jgi:hypothetical protein
MHPGAHLRAAALAAPQARAPGGGCWTASGLPPPAGRRPSAQQAGASGCKHCSSDTTCTRRTPRKLVFAMASPCTGCAQQAAAHLLHGGAGLRRLGVLQPLEGLAAGGLAGRLLRAEGSHRALRARQQRIRGCQLLAAARRGGGCLRGGRARRERRRALTRLSPLPISDGPANTPWPSKRDSMSRIMPSIIAKGLGIAGKPAPGKPPGREASPRPKGPRPDIGKNHTIAPGVDAGAAAPRMKRSVGTKLAMRRPSCGGSSSRAGSQRHTPAPIYHQEQAGSIDDGMHLPACGLPACPHTTRHLNNVGAATSCANATADRLSAAILPSTG